MIAKAWGTRRVRYAGAALVALTPVIVFFATLQEVRVEEPTAPIDSAVLWRDLALTIGDGPAFQRAVLADNTVTFAEHEEAKRRTFQCGEAAGVRMGLEPAVGLRPSSYSITAATEGDMDAAVAKLKACEQEYMVEIEPVWSLTKSLEFDADFSRALGPLTACLLANGADIPGTGIKTKDDLDALRSEVVDSADRPATEASVLKRAQYYLCAREVEEQTGLRLP